MNLNNVFTSKKILACCITTTLLTSVSAIAEGDANRFTVSGKLGKAKTSFYESGFIGDNYAIVEVNGGTSLGLGAAYHFTDEFAIELDYLKSDLLTEILSFRQAVVPVFGRDITSVAVYGALRSQGKFYGMAKLGYMAKKTSIFNETDSATGYSYGVGGGIRLNKTASIEAEYTSLSSDFKFIGLSLRFTF